MHLVSKTKNLLFDYMSQELKLSLAQWSLQKAFQSGTLDPILFAKISKKVFDTHAVEYVSSFFSDKGNDDSFLISMKDRFDEHEVQNFLILVDNEDYLGDEDNKLRQKAIETHYKWIHKPKIMDCHSVIVNAFWAADPSIFKASLIDGLTRLSTYAAKKTSIFYVKLIVCSVQMPNLSPQ